MKPIYYISIGIVLFLLIISIITTCSSNRTKRIITETELKTALIKQERELKTKFLKIEIEKIDSAKKTEAVKTKVAEQKAYKHAAIADNYKAKANILQAELDSLKNIAAPCDEQLDKCEQTNIVLRKVISENDTTIESLGEEAESYSKRLYLSEKQNMNYYMNLIEADKRFSDLVSENEKITKDLKKKNNWFNKNKFWIGLGTGFVGVVLVK